ncbi:MAG TPA: type I-E CRISPR-associated protein Cas6/Cse3/CasE [Gemmatimonadales bacterium]|nr:type I-E CRISPR-associated protein Cas6/Cse3/CasE [Gemmatimonadales bacterium]
MTLLPTARAAGWYREALQHGELARDHAAVWRLFPGDDKPRDFLFRVGTSRADGALSYYVVSKRAPAPEPGVLEVEIKEYAPKLIVGETLAFSLRANPTVSRGEHGRRGKRHDVLMDAKRRASPDKREEAIQEAAIEWLVDRAPTIGLGIDAEHIRYDRYVQHLSRRSHGPPLRFSSVDFDGVATVTDPSKLVVALFTGVGHSKGFGCGLLLIRRFM